MTKELLENKRNDPLYPSQKFFCQECGAPVSSEGSWCLACVMEESYRESAPEQKVQPKKQVEHPMQPLEWVGDTIRFKQNAIVRAVLDAASDGRKLNLTGISINPAFSVEDREQFAQLIGYSVSGFSELPYVRDEIYNRAERAANELIDDRANGTHAS